MSKNLNKFVIVNESDIWRPLADFFTDMIAKYAEEMDYDKDINYEEEYEKKDCSININSNFIIGSFWLLER